MESACSWNSIAKSLTVDTFLPSHKYVCILVNETWETNYLTVQRQPCSILKVSHCVSVAPRLSLQAVAARRRIRHQMGIQTGQRGSLRKATPTAARCQIGGPAIPVCVALRRSTAMSMTWSRASCFPPGTMWILSMRSSTRYSGVTKQYLIIWGYKY